MKDNVTRSNINVHLRELNSGTGSKEDDNDNIERDPPPRKNKLRYIKKR